MTTEAPRGAVGQAHDGRIYYEMRGQQLREPAAVEDRPSRPFLDWHNSEVFLE
jgi:hypothetical protein